MGPGDLIRAHRKRHGLSQLELASRAGISTRHLSYVERGRSRPGRAVVAALARGLGLAPREANRLARAADLRPLHPEHGLDDPAVEPLRAALEAMLATHMPLPAAVTDPSWNVPRANPACTALTEHLAGFTRRPPADESLLEWLFAADGLQPLVTNWAEVGPFLLERARDEAVSYPELDTLVARLERLLAVSGVSPGPAAAEDRVLLALRLAAGDRELRLFSVLARFGSALDANMESLRVEYFFPEDQATRIHIEHLVANR